MLLCTGFALGSGMVDEIASRSCFRGLEATAEQFAADLKNNVERDMMQLELIAGMLAEHEDLESNEAVRHMKSYKQRGLVVSVGMLVPDRQMVFSDDRFITWQEKPVFQQEVEKAPYLSDRCRLGESGEYFVYLTVPIVKSGETKGILYGFIPAQELEKRLSSKAFDGNAQEYIIDAKDGTILMDTWHDTLGNVYDGSMARRVTGGYSKEEWMENIKAGKPCYLVSHSRKADEDFYVYSVPVSLNRWAVLLTVPESVAFEDAEQIRRILYVLGAVDSILVRTSANTLSPSISSLRLISTK